jgi:hypothetical protein
MTTRIERIQLPESAQLRTALVARADSVHPGARVVDADVQGPTGVDLLLVDDDGRPVFVDVVLDSAGEVPTRIFDHTRWYEQNRRLFLRAYTNDGVVRIEDPVFVFVASRFPASVLEVVRAMPDVPVRLVRAEYFLIDGAAEVLLEDVTPSVQERISTSVARRTDDMSAGGESTPRDIIESDAVRALLALFRSGVDGLDGRIATTESDEGISFRMDDRRLADVAVSPGSPRRAAEGRRERSGIGRSVGERRAVGAVGHLGSGRAGERGELAGTRACRRPPVQCGRSRTHVL